MLRSIVILVECIFKYMAWLSLVSTSNLKPHTFPSFRHLDALYMVLSNEYFRNLSLDGYLNLVEAVDTRKRPFMHVALDGIQS